MEGEGCFYVCEGWWYEEVYNFVISDGDLEWILCIGYCVLERMVGFGE